MPCIQGLQTVFAKHIGNILAMARGVMFHHTPEKHIDIQRENKIPCKRQSNHSKNN